AGRPDDECRVPQVLSFQWRTGPALQSLSSPTHPVARDNSKPSPASPYSRRLHDPSLESRLESLERYSRPPTQSRFLLLEHEFPGSPQPLVPGSACRSRIPSRRPAPHRKALKVHV